MRATSIPVAAAACLALCSAARADQAGAPGVVVPVALAAAVSSSDARAGQTFRFETVADVEDGGIAIPAGTSGEGVVSKARAAHFLKGAQLELEPRELRIANGPTIPVSLPAQNTVPAGSQAHVFPFPLFIGPVPLLGAVVNPAKNVTLPAGTRFTVVTR